MEEGGFFGWVDGCEDGAAYYGHAGALCIFLWEYS